MASNPFQKKSYIEEQGLSVRKSEIKGRKIIRHLLPEEEVNFDNLPNTFNVVMLGDVGVGKTALVRAANDEILPPSYRVDFDRHVNNKHILKLAWEKGTFTFNITEIRDGEYKHLQQIAKTDGYPRASEVHFVLLVWDVNSSAGLRRLEKHKKYFERVTGRTNYVYILVGTKAHITIRRKVGPIQLQKFTEKWKLPFIETDAQADINVQIPFMQGARFILRQTIAQ